MASQKNENDQKIAALIEEALKFDPSDDYHGEVAHDLDARSYYAGVNRVVALLEGRIQTWTDPASPPVQEAHRG